MIPSATDTAHFTPVDRAWRAALGLDPDRPVVGFVGLFYRHQGVPTLLHALAKLRPGMPRLLALIVGDGVMRRQWQGMARALHLDDGVRFTGQVPYAEAPGYFNAMDVVVAPFTAHRGETSPFKVLDALACARPVVASDIPSVRPRRQWRGRDGGTGGSGRPRPTPLTALSADPVHRVAMGWKGRGFVEQHASWDRAAAALAAALAGR